VSPTRRFSRTSFCTRRVWGKRITSWDGCHSQVLCDIQAEQVHDPKTGPSGTALYVRTGKVPVRVVSSHEARNADLHGAGLARLYECEYDLHHIDSSQEGRFKIFHCFRTNSPTLVVSDAEVYVRIRFSFTEFFV